MSNKQKKLHPDKQLIQELTADLQRLRADFENYRKRVETEKDQSKEIGKASVVLMILPVIDNIYRAINCAPDNLKQDSWVQGVCVLDKNLEKSLAEIGVKRIEASPGVKFNPDYHDAISFDDSSQGENEVIAEELQPGYLFNDKPIRHAMVRVTRQ